MSIAKKLVTTDFRVENADAFVQSVADSNYFMFVGRHIPYVDGDSNIPQPVDSMTDTLIDVYNNMIFSKRVTDNDVIPVIEKNVWTSGTYYDIYDHEDGDLRSKKYHVVVPDGDQYNVYKCIYNVSNSTVTTPSTAAPSGRSTTIDPSSDGYMWKYMYTIGKSDYEKFSTSAYIPVTPNTDIIAAATPGSIEYIQVVNGGKGYDNYIAEGTFKLQDLVVGGINTIYGAPETAVGLDNYYAGCVIRMLDGPAVGQYRRIVDYVGQGLETAPTKRFILDAPFSPAPVAGNTYEVYPYAFVWGDGSETTPAEGIAIIDSTANSVSEVEMLNPGENYRAGSSYPGLSLKSIPYTVDSVFIDVPASIQSSYTPAELRPIISPPGGHGSDPIRELGARHVCISTKFTNSESGSIPIENDFRQVGLIKDPLFDNVVMTLSSSAGNFNVGDTVYQFKQHKLSGNVTVSTSSTSVIKTDQGKLSTTVQILEGGSGYDSVNDVIEVVGGDGSGFVATFETDESGVITNVIVSNPGSSYTTVPTLVVNSATGVGAQLVASLANPQIPLFKDSFSIGDYFLVTKGNNIYVGTVANVPQDYQITAEDNATFSASDCDISALVLQASGTVVSSLGGITLTNVKGTFTEGSKVIDINNDAVATIETIEINGKALQLFNTAVQLTRLVGTYDDSTAFEEDELIRQTNILSYAQPKGYVHHIEGTGEGSQLYISNKFGIFNNDAEKGVRPINGDSSDAQLTHLSNKYFGDFVVDSGKVLYIENIDAVTRSGNKSENIRIILEF